MGPQEPAPTPVPSCPDCPSAGPRPDAVALFVHGIGAQRPGSTLAGHTGPLLSLFNDLTAGETPPVSRVPTISNVRRVYRHHPPSPARSWRWLLARLWGRPRPPEPLGVPSHELWEVTSRSGDGASRVTYWLLAESCWSRSFPLPHPIRFAWWLWRVVWWLVLVQLGAAWAQHFTAVRPSQQPPEGRFPSPVQAARIVALGAVSYFGFAPRLLAAVLVLAVAPLIAVLGTIPVLRAPIIALVIDTAGDSFAALLQPHARRRMLDTIRGDLRWLRAHLPPGAGTLVVAHSQGGMLTRDALEREAPGDRVTFFALGSGLGLLHALRQVSSPLSALRAWLGGLGFTLMLALNIAALLVSTPPFLDAFATAARSPTLALTDPWGLTAEASAAQSRAELLVLLAMASGAVGATALRGAGITAMIAQWSQRLRLPEGTVAEWTDYSSRYDPVSCGPVLATVADCSVAVVNSPWPLLEHTRYRRNRRVLLDIAETMARFSGIAIPAEPARRAYERSARHTRRMAWVQLLFTVVGEIFAFALVVTFGIEVAESVVRP
ncbi:hypothetical protein [Salinactinospora qingdaonensis]|uniref:Alpha/beta hydrolase family protein n=1 Tax=Salinactinospora qingdaonensis TaxID=702744 RepID=A0ABP7FKC3_9ACTN